MMLRLVLFVCGLVAANAIVCIPRFCAGVTQPPLNCKGAVIKNGGYCGCTDVCAKIEGERCQYTVIFGIPSSLGTCDHDLTCERPNTTNTLLGWGGGVCVQKTPKRDVSTMTKCQQMRRAMMMAMFVTATKWTPTCDSDGNFTPHQCDFSGDCFCVTSDGHALTTRQHGKVDCSNIQ